MTQVNPYYDALKAIVYQWAIIDGHHDLHHDGEDWQGDQLVKALPELEGYTPGLTPEEQQELAAIYADGYGQARGEDEDEEEEEDED